MKNPSTATLLKAVWRAKDVASGLRIESLFRVMKPCNQSMPETRKH